MFKGILVPYSLSVENKYLSIWWILENHFWIKVVSVPHQLIINNFSWNFFKVSDVDVMSFYLTEWFSFMENNLLSVWQEFCMPSKMLLYNPSSWDESEGNKRWKEEDIISWDKEPETEKTKRSKVTITPFQNVWSLLWLIQETTVLMSLYTIIASVMIDWLVWAIVTSE